ncbi:hypothetical protein [Anditalea andensis]|uniref:Viral A-type inclusion protein n=1 Tax=Anditalea andensis TaxID=1048983 RepID=A0A074LKQ0_9BACT|nr:hypothetical protein [Anditalea andensis]KEO74422.1 hypothetical protein EL17_06710 [Anditalea andensis]
MITKCPQISLLYGIFLGVLLSCGSPGSSNKEQKVTVEEKSTNDELKNEVIAIHDEVMPKMGALKSHQKRLHDEVADLQSRNEGQYQEGIEIRQRLAHDLDQAYEDMFIWMRQFRPELEGMDEQESKAYLLDQKEKVIIVNENIKSALSRAEEVTL